MNQTLSDSTIEAVKNTKYPRKYKGHIQYGTSGFREKSDILDHVLYRIGLLAVLRSKKKNATVGIMITASHNPEPDNGTKIVDPAGEMLETSWEKIATDIANVEDNLLISTLESIIKYQQIDLNIPSTIIIGRDTRKSSPSLLNATIEGIKALNGTIKDFGIVTTPQLHYLVVCTNTNGSYGKPTVEGYYEKLSNAFKHVRGSQRDNGNYVGELELDAANGVGAIAAKKFQKYLDTTLIMNIYNDGTGELNHTCGADYVKIQQTVPRNTPEKALNRCVSLDGDADRIVYFYTDNNGKFHLLDGDRIATLVAGYLKELLKASDLSLQLGLVQTAYANGESTNYISNVLKVPVACVPTGIKHLHHKAMDFDIGVYFEANGHGSVLFKSHATKTINDCAKNTSLPEPKRLAALKLQNIMDIINQTVGDALSDMLLVETILHEKSWSVVDWYQSYTDLPNKQIKVRVKDRNLITTTDAERRCVTPIGLQEEIDKIAASYPKGRSFVRPSGTEDIVRVYAECESLSDVKKLAFEVSLLVYKMADGVGPEPTLS